MNHGDYASPSSSTTEVIALCSHLGLLNRLEPTRWVEESKCDLDHVDDDPLFNSALDTVSRWLQQCDDLHTYRSKEWVEESDRDLYLVDDDPLSSSALDTVSRWVQQCDGLHTCRSKEEGNPTLPRRVLDLGGQDRQSIRLYEPKAQRAKYVALSHCWGASQPFVTNKTNVDQFKSGIQADAMPKTFQDAVSFTRFLKIRYLWIDSLCIIQDDLGDWQEECPKMANIYRSAYLTIAASRASSDADGFLRPREPAATFCGSVTCGKKTIALYLVPRRLDPTLGITGNHAPLGNEPLSIRGWAFQERAFSRRTLYFGSRQMYWECHQCLASENGDKCDPYRDGIPRSPSGQDDVFTWYRTTEEYTHGALTRSSDKLPAISGIASEYARLQQDDYLAGHWHKTLLESLLWTQHYAENRLDTSQPYRAPSWSWASVHGPVSFRHDFTSIETTWTRLATVKGAQVTLAGLDPYGEVTGGTLDLLAPLIPIQSTPRTTARLPDRTLIIEDSHVYRDPGRGAAAGQFYAVVLLSFQIGCSRAQKDERMDRHGGLVVTKAENNPGSYCRVGILQSLHTMDFGLDYVPGVEKYPKTLIRLI